MGDACKAPFSDKCVRVWFATCVMDNCPSQQSATPTTLNRVYMSVPTSPSDRDDGAVVTAMAERAIQVGDRLPGGATKLRVLLQTLDLVANLPIVSRKFVARSGLAVACSWAGPCLATCAGARSKK